MAGRRGVWGIGGWALVAAVASCGLGVTGEASDATTNAEDASIAPSSPGEGGALTDAPDEGGGEAGLEAGPTEPTLPPATPGEVACTNGPCTPPTQFCCRNKNRCDGNTSACGGVDNVGCDEPADCPGAACCLGPSPVDDEAPASACAATCAAGSVRVCRTSVDCSGAPCVAVSCLGRTFGVCSGPAPSVCTDG